MALNRKRYPPNRHLEPDLAARFQQGIFLPGEAQLDNRAFYHASLEQLKDKINIMIIIVRHQY